MLGSRRKGSGKNGNQTKKTRKKIRSEESKEIGQKKIVVSLFKGDKKAKRTLGRRRKGGESRAGKERRENRWKRPPTNLRRKCTKAAKKEHKRRQRKRTRPGGMGHKGANEKNKERKKRAEELLRKERKGIKKHEVK